MRVPRVWSGAVLAGALVLGGWVTPIAGQSVVANAAKSAEVLPDAPLPAIAFAAANEGPAASESGQPSWSSASPQAQPGAQADKDAGSSSSQAASDAAAARAEQREKARKQLNDEEKQRVLGVMPNFATTYLWDAAHLSAGQKMSLALRSAVDPFTFAAAVLVAGAHEALDDEPGFQWGAAGFGQRAGAAYLDAFDGNMIGTGILPALLHQDPRYFRMGRHGSFRRRLLYSIEATVVCRGDNGRNQFNYSNLGGNLAAGAISNLYYPNQNAGVGQTISTGLIVTAENTAGGVFDEFWPDISRKLFHKDPTHGLDAQPAAAAQAQPTTPGKN